MVSRLCAKGLNMHVIKLHYLRRASPGMNFAQGMHGSKDRAIKLLSNSDGVIPLGLTVGHAGRVRPPVSIAVSQN